ncbi:MAG: hypothetical protein WCP59_02620 [Actinomycetota bacterium]
MARRLSFSPQAPSDQRVGRAGRGHVDALESVVLFARFRHQVFVKVWHSNGVVGTILAEGLLNWVIPPVARMPLCSRWSPTASARAQVVEFVDRGAL